MIFRVRANCFCTFNYYYFNHFGRFSARSYLFVFIHLCTPVAGVTTMIKVLLGVPCHCFNIGARSASVLFISFEKISHKKRTTYISVIELQARKPSERNDTHATNNGNNNNNNRWWLQTILLLIVLHILQTLRIRWCCFIGLCAAYFLFITVDFYFFARRFLPFYAVHLTTIRYSRWICVFASRI